MGQVGLGGLGGWRTELGARSVRRGWACGIFLLEGVVAAARLEFVVYCSV